MDVELDISTPGPSTVVDKRQDWVDPIVGGRVFLDLTDNLSLVLRGDIGGFGVGSDFTWNVAGLLLYDFDLFGKDASVVAGYRVLDQDFEDGSGANKFAYDVTTHGPILGAAHELRYRSRARLGVRVVRGVNPVAHGLLVQLL